MQGTFAMLQKVKKMRKFVSAQINSNQLLFLANKTNKPFEAKHNLPIVTKP